MVAVAVLKKIVKVHSTEEIKIEGDFLRLEIEKASDRFNQAVRNGDKNYIRKLHVEAKSVNPAVNAQELIANFERHRRYFKHGSQIDPTKIEPTLHLVEPRSEWEQLFKICRGYWSMPYSYGYGRRLRFVLFDQHHEAVIGIMGLQSPPADLACRDELFDYPKSKKMDIINCMLDAYTLGSIPPYSELLGGKLVASLVASDTVRQAYWRQYASKKTIMQQKRLLQPLLAVTTSSAFGRSSMYNRIKVNGRLLAEPIGYTKGFGTIHLESLYPQIAAWLKKQEIFVPAGFGNGPKVRWQNISIAMQRLGLSTAHTSHGLRREVFLFRHVTNLEDVCAGKALPIPYALDAHQLFSYWKERWAIPRALRNPSWQNIDTPEIILSGLTQLLSDDN